MRRNKGAEFAKNVFTIEGVELRRVSALRTKQLTGGVGAKPCAAIYGGLTFMCILVSFYNCCFLFLFGFVRKNAFNIKVIN